MSFTMADSESNLLLDLFLQEERSGHITSNDRKIRVANYLRLHLNIYSQNHNNAYFLIPKT